MIQFNKYFSFFLVLVFFLLLNSIRVNSQESNTLYYMDRIPQSNLLNPAIQPNYNFSLTLPGSDVYFRYDNNSTAIKDFLIYQADVDSFITPFHSSYDPNEFLNKLKPSNHFLIENQVSLFSLGIRVKTLYFKVDVRENSMFKLAYPRDLMSFVMLGTEEFSNRNADFSGLDFDIKNYTEIGFGISKSFMDDRLYVGARAKLLYGKMNLTSTSTDIALEANYRRWSYYNNVIINAAGLIEIDNTESNFFDAFSFNFDDALDYVKNMPNKGMAFDIGGIFNVNDKISVSASVIDIGSINWKDNAYEIQITSDTVSFEGIDLDAIGSSDPFGVLGDTISNAFDYTSAATSFKTTLPMKIFVGGNYKLTERINFGALYKARSYRGETEHSTTLSANLTPVNFFTLAGTYTIVVGREANFGAGMGFKFGPSQFFVVSDNLSQMFYPMRTKTLSFRFGMNFVFGDKKKRDKKKAADDKDIPLLEDDELLIEE